MFTFHRLKHFEETQIPTTEYGQLLESIHSVTPDEHREWLSKQLQHLNDPTLRKRLQRLGAETKQVTGGLTGKISRWASTIADVRNELTHTSKSKIDTFPGGVLHWLGESIYAVLRICLLKECIADDDFDRLAGSQGASQLEAFVGASLTEAHEILKILKQRANSA